MNLAFSFSWKVAGRVLHPGNYNKACANFRLLSDAIDVLDAEQLGQMEREVRGFPVKLLDVTRGVDIPGFLSSWEGGFTVRSGEGWTVWLISGLYPAHLCVYNKLAVLSNWDTSFTVIDCTGT